MDFPTTFTAVMSANLLTVMFVWAMVNISRREERKESFGTYMIGFLTPLLFLLGNMLVAFDKVPAWLDYALQ